MQHEKHIKRAKPKKRMSRTAILLTAIIVLVGAVVGTTIAYLTQSVEIKNTFTTAAVTCEVHRNNGEFSVENTGSTSAYIRAAIVANWTDADGAIAASVPGGYKYTLTLNETDWVKGSDGYYYYKTPVAAAGDPVLLITGFTSTVPSDKAYSLSIEVVASAIQSNPAKAVTEAWGVTVADDGTISK